MSTRPYSRDGISGNSRSVVMIIEHQLKIPMFEQTHHFINNVKVISRFMGLLQNRLLEFNDIIAIGFIIADLYR